ncbi:bZIP transcription factor [Rhizobium sp. YIM 134829]|uniref:bZIP transcription factor n=1 Tax=Rhizobium sp. YIM 134829 TaxID=3390453 RepID=UPI00397C9D2A
MKRLLLILCSLLMCGTAIAEPGAPVPKWSGTKDFPILAEGFQPAGLVVDYPAFVGNMWSYTQMLKDWIDDANSSFISLEDKVEALENEVSDLKRRVAQLESAQPGGKPVADPRIDNLIARVEALEKAKGTANAPFNVVSASGKALFQVDAYGNSQFQGATGQGAIGIGFVGDGASIAAFSPHGSFAASIGESGGQLQVQSDSGKTSAYVIASDKVGLHLTSGEKHTDLAADEDLFGLKLSQGEKPAASLGTLPGKGVALRLFNTQGQQVVSAGANPDQGGAGIVAAGVSDGSRSAAILSGQQDGSGLVQAFATDGTGAAALVGKERSVAAYNKAGNPVATIGQSDKSEGGTVVARNPSGEGIFAAGFASEYGGGEACVWRAKRSNTFCLGLGLPGMGVGK